jgi:Flp pilus assembly secretin CpaC
MVILAGTVTEGRIARRVLDIARGTGAQVIDQLNVPPPDQILLQVRVAEVSRTAISSSAPTSASPTRSGCAGPRCGERT